VLSGSGRTSAWDRRGRLVVLAAALVFGVQLVWQHPWSPPAAYVDLQVYREAALKLIHGQDPYSALPGLSLLFTYPPFALLVFLPTLLVGMGTLRVAHLALSLVALLVSVRYALIMAREERGPRLMALVLVLSALVLPFKPVVNTLRLGQIDLILLAAVLVDLSGRTRRLPQGVLIGVAAGIKLLPGIFIVYFAITRRTRPALVALAAFLGTVLAGLAVAPVASWHYWTRLVFEARRVGSADAVLNQSLRSVALRMHWGTTAWVVAVAVTGVAGVAISVRLNARGYRLLSVCVFATTGLLVAPISWIHHWVWAVPVAVVLLIAAWDGRRSSWRVMLFLAAGLWLCAFMTWPFRLQVASWLPASLQGWAGELYVVAGLVAVAAAGVASLRLPAVEKDAL
jgi:alpha-1,2-mannosyltransferase